MNPLAKNLLIRASAGSGKTYQLGNRVIGLVALGVPPEQIAALTFTRKAAGEFADSVLTKLARAATDPITAQALATTLSLPNADFPAALAKVIRALPTLVLGTMDSFFAKVVRSFQYELGITGGRFELLEGPELESARDALLASILGERLDADTDDPFFHAFRRAMAGQEGLRVAEGLRDFARVWHSVYRENADLRWGPQELAGTETEAWEQHKHTLLATIRNGIHAIVETRSGQVAKTEELLDQLAVHTIASGSLPTDSGLFASLIAAVAETSAGPLTVRYYKDFTIPDPAATTLRQLLLLLARCELAAALARTRGVREVMAVYDARCEQMLRRRGMLGFDDIKFLMGRWSRDETARLRREWVDFRLDSRHGHWLLDEFQDTSRADWLGLQPLIDEAASGDESTVFIVGDRKQAIYGWRGGEVGLFDEIERRYRGGLETADMAESWRSCPQVLDLVNRVCGATEIMACLFGAEPVSRWIWEDHVSAPHLCHAAKAGEARVEIVDGKREGRLERMVAILRDELGVGQRPLSCGILVRSNALVREIADFLRDQGFDVIEDGRCEPARDHPVGVAIAHLMLWLADPANRFARGVVDMSPFGPEILARHGDWTQAWSAMTERIARSGMAPAVEDLIRARAAEWSTFGQRRAAEMITALQSLDHRGGITLAAAADHLQRLEISQPPGVAAIQIMTIHKAKGLGFDIVMLPEIPSEAIPNAMYFTLATGQDWLTQPPAKWARELLPDLREAEQIWAAAQRYESMCLLYVALTRAKRGLYLLLDPPSQKADPDHPSLANWIGRALDAPLVPGVIYQSGAADWTQAVPETPATRPDAASRPRLGTPIPRRTRVRPSAGHAPTGAAAASAAFGTAVHRLLERVAWLDEDTPDFPDDDAGRLVAALTTVPEIRSLLEKGGRPVRLLREQPFETVQGGAWLAGVIDRLHLHLLPDGSVGEIDLIDFKTDAVTSPDELLARHRGQLECYRAALARIHPAADIRAFIVSTHLRRVLPLDAPA